MKFQCGTPQCGAHLVRDVGPSLVLLVLAASVTAGQGNHWKVRRDGLGEFFTVFGLVSRFVGVLGFLRVDVRLHFVAHHAGDLCPQLHAKARKNRFQEDLHLSYSLVAMLGRCL